MKREWLELRVVQVVSLGKDDVNQLYLTSTDPVVKDVQYRKVLSMSSTS